MNQTNGAQGDNLELQGRVALMTGAARRVGATVARHLHGAGMDLAIHYRRSRAAADTLCAELNSQRPGSCALFGGDLLDLEVLQQLPTQVVEHYGRLDVLHNNASTFYPTPLGEIDESAWEDLMGTNLKAPLFLSQGAAPYLREQRGCIINMVDIYAERALPKHPVYCAAKAGLVMLTQSLARELGPEVRVNGIAPGAVLWPEDGSDDASQDAMIRRTALKRAGSPQDIARAALFLIRDAAYTTGQILRVDGGRLI